MKLIYGMPGTGKTKELLKLSQDNNVVILAESEARVQRLLVKAAGYGFRIPTPITLDDLNENIKEVYVDDIERFFNVAFNVKVKTITINKDEDLELEHLN